MIESSPSAVCQEKPGLTVVVDENEHQLRLRLIHVMPSYRGRGLAKQAMREMCVYADIRRLAIVLWVADPLTWDMEGLIGFYKSFGFRVAGRPTREGCIPMLRRVARETH